MPRKVIRVGRPEKEKQRKGGPGIETRKGRPGNGYQSLPPLDGDQIDARLERPGTGDHEDGTGNKDPVRRPRKMTKKEGLSSRDGVE